MHSIYNLNHNEFIAYKEYKSKKKSDFTIIFFHGLMSDMDGSKATALYKWCVEEDIHFIAFDNFGHGKSSGIFEKQTIDDWLNGGICVLEKIINKKAILIGSSAGAFITLLLGLLKPELVKGIITIAGAPDFTESIYNSMTKKEQIALENDIVQIGPYPISKDLINSGHRHSLLTQDIINITCPVHLIHGMKDDIVKYDISEKIMHKLNKADVILKLIKNGDHSLSTKRDLKIITNSIIEILNSGSF